mgnify:FL=1
MKKLIYIYSVALLVLLIASSFLASNEHVFVITVYSLILLVMLLNDIVIKKNNKEILFEVLLILLFVGIVFFTRNNFSYSNIFLAVIPLTISIFRTVKDVELE